MASRLSSVAPQKLPLFLNISFLFLLSFFLTYKLNHHTIPDYVHLIRNEAADDTDSCAGVNAFNDYRSKCLYVKSHSGCKPQGYINYLQIFYCIRGESSFLGYVILILWLVVMLYLLGDTAASYFCPSLESLSKILNLSPTIAGVTLLSFGNGAPDFFSSVVSFTRSGNGDIGLNSILGAGFFVSSFVVGVICVSISPKEVSIDKFSFIRDVVFLLISLGFLLLIAFIGKVTLWIALCYVSIYLLYVGFLSTSHFFHREKQEASQLLQCNEDSAEVDIPLPEYINDETPILVEQTIRDPQNQEQEPEIWNLGSSTGYHCLSTFLRILELPLYLPRRLTIPVVSEQRWSKPYAVASVTLAPLVLAELCSFRNIGSEGSLALYITSGLVGLILGILAFMTTEVSRPPEKWLLPWLAGGFAMSVTWIYIVANELVSLLVALGIVFGISPSLLGLTILAWGNSLGDLITNVTLAMNGGPDGAHIAISGCYAGPIFNIVIGLGVPLFVSSFATYPHGYVIPSDSSLYETIGFLMGGLVWALAILPRKNMRLDRLLGGGLLAIYFCFLFLRLAEAFRIF